MAGTSRQVARESWARFVGFVPQMGHPLFALGWSTAVVAGSAILLAAGAALSRWVPYGALAFQVVLGGLLVLGAYAGFWSRRARYRAVFGASAYQRLFLRFVGPTIAVLAAAAWMPVATVSGPRLPEPLAVPLVVYLLGTASLIVARGSALFWNVDLRAFVYSVYPEQGALVASPLFDRLRHPIYSASVRAILAVAVVWNNAEALACAALLAILFRLWASVEEAEMVERFPEYSAYRARVPAFFVFAPAAWYNLMRYLLLGRA